MEPQVSVAFPKNKTLLDFLRVILVHILFLSTLYQLTDGTPNKNHLVCDRRCPIRDTVYAEVLIQSKNTL